MTPLVVFLLLLLGTAGIAVAALVRWPHHVFTTFFVFNVFWSCVFTNAGSPTWARIHAVLALISLVLMAARAASAARGPRPQHHRVAQGSPYPTARPLRRVP